VNAIEMLMHDHEKVRKLFRVWGEAGPRQSEKSDVVDQALMELQIHSKLEEEIFYPAVKAKAKSDELTSEVDEGYEEHRQVDNLVAELKSMNVSDPTFEDRWQALTGAVEYHIAEEEGEMLPKASEVLGSDLDSLTEKMTQRREELTRELLPTLGSKSRM
jgi:hemerythrin-like domain-containing protein